jgi:hypothetical protein
MTSKLVNVLRTLPYTAYQASFVVGLLWPETQSLRFFVALMLQEGLNHGLKIVIKALLPARITDRPKGAMDTGIYPSNVPKLSGSSGMPSGHSQTGTFLCYYLLQMAKPAAAGQIFIYGTTALLLLSRTKYGGKSISAHVEGKEITGCHTVAQVVAGGLLGAVLGHFSYPYVFLV